MATVHLLGTGAAISGEGRTTTMLALTDGPSTLIIDCGGDVMARMQQACIAPASVDALFLTHEHIDHVGGFPLFYKKLWLAGRERPLPVYGLPQALMQAARCFATYDTRAFIGLPPVDWHAIDPGSDQPAFQDETWRVEAAHGQHGVPSVGLRITSTQSGGAAAYSSDTRPCEGIQNLAAGVDLLFHEATGASPGHSTAQQAAQVARAAGAKRLVLVHLPPALPDSDLAAARATFARTEVGNELQSYAF